MKKKKKVEKEKWRKKERGMFWKVESGSRENKKGEDGIYGHTCVVEKNQEKKKWKKKKRMDDRKKERKNNI